MLLTRVRVRPWSCRARRESLGRATRTSPFSTVTVISRSSFWLTLPLGPSTLTRPGCAVTLTLSGILIASLPMRDMMRSYQTVAISSPPRCCLRASRSTSTPFEVERMAMPRPFITLGMSVWRTYRRRPGLDCRRISLMAGRFSLSYLRTTWRLPWTPPSLVDTSRMKPSARSTSQTRSFSFEAGRSSSSSPARCALRIRVNRSATGSVMLMTCSSPRRLEHAGDLALQGAIAETDPAHLELAEKGAVAAAQLAAVVGAHLELRLEGEALRLRDLGKLGHDYAVLKGMPMWRSRARPSSSLFAVVTMVMFMPLIFSILS